MCLKVQMETQVTDLQKQISSDSRLTEPLPVPEDVKQQVTMTLNHQTGMNLQWSLKCLIELEWNYDNAFSAFKMFQNTGKSIW